MEVNLLNFKSRLAQARNFDEVFEIVKASVENILGLHRAGLTLVLADLPNGLGAYHVSGSNAIVLNRSMLGAVRSVTRSEEELNSFIYSILTHEYLHSLGFLEESQVRPLVRKISQESLGPDHPSVTMASGDLFSLYPQLRALGEGKVGEDFEIIKEFDRSSMPYIG